MISEKALYDTFYNLVNIFVDILKDYVKTEIVGSTLTYGNSDEKY